VAVPLAPDFHTADMVRAMPDDGNRYEVVWGELFVTPSPVRHHQRIVGRLLVALLDYCERAGIGEALTSPADISWGIDSLVQPDAFVVAPEHTSDEWRDVKNLRLVIEVLNPTTARRDRFQKRKLYQANGVEVLWLVDHERQIVETWTPDAMLPQVETERVTWHPLGAMQPLTLVLKDLFRS
jgi:Uma2 family endonuclease